MTIGWCFDNTYSRLPDVFKENINPIPVNKPELVILNKNLAEKLNLNFLGLNDKEISEIFSYISAFSLAYAHVYNLKHCQCNDGECCND